MMLKTTKNVFSKLKQIFYCQNCKKLVLLKDTRKLFHIWNCVNVYFSKSNKKTSNFENCVRINLFKNVSKLFCWKFHKNVFFNWFKYFFHDFLASSDIPTCPKAYTQMSNYSFPPTDRSFKGQCPTGFITEETFKDIYSQFFPFGGLYDCSN